MKFEDYREEYTGKRNAKALQRQYNRVQKTFAEKDARMLERQARLGSGPAEDAPTQPSMHGIVVGIDAARCLVLVGEEACSCTLSPAVARLQQTTLAVGDEVEVSQRNDRYRVESVLPRRTTLSRPDPGNAHRQRVLVANVDVVVIVCSVGQPPLKPGFIDRVLLAITHGGAEAVICVNKIDLLSPAERREEMLKLEPYAQLELPIFTVSTMTGEGIRALRLLLAGRRAVLVGHSGVGKSSLLNAFDSTLQLRTNTMRGDGKGRHTTTASALYQLADDIEIIDTPGVKAFALWAMQMDDIRDAFYDFAAYTAGCRFADCSHTHEPGCAVKAAVESGEISAERYGSYLRLVAEVEG